MLLSRKWSIFDLLPLCRHLIACKSVMRVPRYKVYTRTLYANGRVFEKCQISTNACFIISIGGGGGFCQVRWQYGSGAYCARADPMRGVHRDAFAIILSSPIGSRVAFGGITGLNGWRANLFLDFCNRIAREACSWVATREVVKGKLMRSTSANKKWCNVAIGRYFQTVSKRIIICQNSMLFNFNQPVFVLPNKLLFIHT